MSEQKRYTAQEMRDAANVLDCENTCGGYWRSSRAMKVTDKLRQAADAEEENAKLKARLEAVVKIASDNLWCEDSGVVETDTCAKLHNSYMSDILRAARGE